MRLRSEKAFELRRKVVRSLSKVRVRLIVGFVLCFLGVALFVGLSYRYFILLEEKLFFLNRADEMLNTILEARRYEKNYFLFHQEADFKEAIGYFNKFEHLVQINRGEIRETMPSDSWSNLRELSWIYRRSLSVAHDIHSNKGVGDANEVLQASIERIRSSGQVLIQQAEDLARSERNFIQGILYQYRFLFGAFFICFLLAGAIVVYFLEVKVVKPLHTIEEATRIVAQGDFRPIQWVRTRDEIGSLVQAFNHMVQQLRESREQMVQTEKLSALGTLTSGVAHQLNNPLGNISTSCQILLEERDDTLRPYHQELLTSIDDQVNKARDIVRALLEFSRERDFELRAVDLREMVEDTLKLIRGEIPANVEARVDLPPGVLVQLDKARMEQALLNLVMNSVQAMEGGGILTIRGRVLSDSQEVLLEVTDTGAGIPPDVLPRIFDPFFTTKDVGRGTGLGLSVAYGIIERHYGSISVESQVSEGTKFTVRLPMRR